MTARALADMGNRNAFSIICVFLIMRFNYIFIMLRFIQSGNILPYCIKGV